MELELFDTRRRPGAPLYHSVKPPGKKFLSDLRALYVFGESTLR